MKTDIFGVTPEVGDIIVYNLPKFKGLIHGKCMGFSKAGLPEVEIDNNLFAGWPNKNGYYTPKTGFLVYKLKKTT